MSDERRILLVDNGSVEPASTLQLRRLAEELTTRLGMRVDPVSLAHSEKVPATALAGRPAELFEDGLDRLLAEGAGEIVVLPLFVGPTHAIVRHVPAVMVERRKAFPAVRIAQAEPLFVPGEARLAQILTEHIRSRVTRMAMPAATSFLSQVRQKTGRDKSDAAAWRTEARGGAERTVAGKIRVAVVDHGSPSRAVTEVRDAVVEQVRVQLRDQPVEIAACSMERRPGPEFAFNEPLLETLLAREGWRTEPVIVALLFIAPGKHAGPTGDVARIVARARGGSTEGVYVTPVMGEHPRLVDILADRANAVMVPLAARA